MVSTIDLGDVDYMAFAMEEKDRIRDKIPSVTLTVDSETRVSSTVDDVAPSNSFDAEVSFRFSAVNEFDLISTLISGIILRIKAARHLHFRKAGKYQADSGSGRVWQSRCDR